MGHFGKNVALFEDVVLTSSRFPYFKPRRYYHDEGKAYSKKIKLLDESDFIREVPPPPPPVPFVESFQENVPMNQVEFLKDQSENEYVVYPNPANSSFTIERLKVENSICYLMTTQGKVVRSFRFDDLRYSVNTLDLPAGLYTLSIRTESGMRNIRVLLI